MNLANYWSTSSTEKEHMKSEAVPLEIQAEEARKRGENPCIVLFGMGTVGQKCKGCVHLRFRPERNPKARYWKCDLRPLTHGRATDHKVSFPACARYEERTEEYAGG